MMKPKHPVALIVLLTLFFVVSSTTLAQQACPALVNRAFNQLGTNCADLGPNSICYGYDRLITEFAEGADITFASPSDRAELTQLAQVDATSLDTTAGTWGIGVMRVQANLPAALPGQGAVFILIGDTSVINMVDEVDAVVMPEEMLDVRVSSATDVLSFPPNFGNRVSSVVGRFNAGTALKADSITADGAWVRVGAVVEIATGLQRATGWVSATALETFDSTALARVGAENPTPIECEQGTSGTQCVSVVNASSQTPMQTFILNTGLGAPGCAEAPRNQLLVQGPSTYELEFNANGVTIRTYSTASLSIVQVAGQSFLRVIPVTGEVVIPDPLAPDALDRAVRVPASQYIDIPVVQVNVETPFGLQVSRRIVDFASGFANFKARYDADVAAGLFRLTQAIVGEFLNGLSNLPPNIINYIIRPIIIIIPSGVGNPRPIIQLPPGPPPFAPPFPRPGR